MNDKLKNLNIKCISDHIYGKRVNVYKIKYINCIQYHFKTQVQFLSKKLIINNILN